MTKKYLKILTIVFLYQIILTKSVISQSSSQCDEGGSQNGQLGCGGFEDCLNKLKGKILEWVVTAVRSIDPNTITGPKGYASPQWVSVKDKMSFRVDFENDGKLATAPAQSVYIKMPVHPSFNINSFRLGSFGFGPYIFQVPENTTYYTTRLDLRDSLHLFADFSAGIDIVNHQVFWSFRSIDPATGLAPVSATAGFLAVSDTGSAALTDTVARGKGYVTFLISPDSTVVHTGDTTVATASIVFDANESVATNTWMNTVDALPPFSVVSIAGDTAGYDFPISWSGADDANGSGVRHYDIYYSKNSGPFVILKAETDSTNLIFPGGEAGATYSFFSRATDNTGNTEAAKTSPEANTTILPQSKKICPGGNIIFPAPSYGPGFSYRWQVNQGNGYIDIDDNSLYSGTATKLLNIDSMPSSWYGYLYRARITNGSTTTYGNTWTLKFSSTWKGNTNDAWENPDNWDCHQVPDEYTDVIINTGVANAPIINSEAICRSLNAMPGSGITVKAGFSLQIKGKNL
ncbi:MAG: hypothetical protein ABIQ31_27585 [Ferruginibacter sp.]